ncbi:MAG: hypothetical protein US50_C0016G0011 [Candidatus Nomurabacteria bacterium GW2011_GWB1_37_5]|uniref:DUF488 domain-containing protein n=1 Tax=Candidatus Nomurabacteria bacterium GW2011_GWB1_37_5 TaxID=1618742 RepID=A0A0G0K419_9BACT|nr:MAG: hypothetical protein US50_C0016G0011 [Candidatus Nomurabacteria bacterium GW2011_GWB1_37_5]
MLHTKCILSPKHASDGIRISVMSRHTLSDGITPDLRIRNNAYEIHLRLLAPSPKLIGNYHKRNLAWADFEKRYLEEIRTAPKNSIIKLIAQMALKEDLTIMCIEDKADFCHRRLLAEECQRYEPALEISHQ